MGVVVVAVVAVVVAVVAAYLFFVHWRREKVSLAATRGYYARSQETARGSFQHRQRVMMTGAISIPGAPLVWESPPEAGSNLTGGSTAGAVEKTSQEEGRFHKLPGPLRQKSLMSSRSSPSLQSRSQGGASVAEAEDAPEAAAVRPLSLCSPLSLQRSPEEEEGTYNS